MSTSCMAPATLRTARCRHIDVHQYKGDCDRQASVSSTLNTARRLSDLRRSAQNYALPTGSVTAAKECRTAAHLSRAECASHA